MQDSRLKIAFVDDHPLIMEGLKTLLQRDAMLQIAGLFENGQSFLEHIQTNEIDIVLLDVSLPDSNGMDLCRQIKLQAPQTIVLMLSNIAERGIILTAIQNGANGYLLKNTSLQQLREAIFKALDGTIVFSKEVNEIISSPAKNELPQLPRLTKREKEILQMIAAGKTSNQIADELFLSPLTVDTHRKNLMQKFGVKNTAGLISMAAQQLFL
ncbi:MAG TPA: response regulator transcription factor [Niabella sp.]